MLTGFEALGAASAVLQVISFAGSVASQCYKIYDGQITSQQDLETYATQMIDAVGRVQNRYPLIPQGSADEKKLAEIAKQCIEAAKALETETQSVTKLCKKGSLSKAFHGAFRATRHKGKIEQLEKSLQGYKELMEAHLLLKLCTKSDAIQQQQSTVFPSLEKDVQNLILQIAEGYQKTGDLIRVEQHTTRRLINTEANATRKEIHEEVRGLGTTLFSSSQHERLLKSLKVSEMNQRYHDVMDSADASFERVFLSYDRVTSENQSELDSAGYETSEDGMSDTNSVRTESDISEHGLFQIDQVWTQFTSWLSSNDEQVFWIRGKPGSGKSTLMKFVVDSDNTKHLLASWRPGAKIMSHFFWKIGTRSQNSVKGLLCSLIHCFLDGNTAMIDLVLEHFAASSSKDSYHDWSVRDLETVLFLAMNSQTQAICIFLDALDELSDRERVVDLKNLITKLNAYDNVKVCVSSRPETQLLNMFGAISTKSLRLEDLTRPEMAVYVRKEFQAVEAENQTSPAFQEQLAEKLLYKAEGVFLWLFLAIKSVISGIRNYDDQAILLERLNELPRDLEDLYADMWSRLNSDNSVYRESAARYFNYAITTIRPDFISYSPTSTEPMDLSRLTLAEVALAETTDMHHMLTPGFDKKDFPDLKSMCKTTSANIESRCAGLLQLRSHSTLLPEIPQDYRLLLQEVSFVHRTAHDFLVDTEAGQRILNHRNDSSLPADTAIRLVRSQLCLAIILHMQFKTVTDLGYFVGGLDDFVHRFGDLQAAESILSVAQDLFSKDVMTFPRPRGFPRSGSLSLLARYFPTFDNFIMSSLKSINSFSVATDVLRELSVRRQKDLPLPFVRQIIDLGADPHAPGLSRIPLFITSQPPRVFSHKVTSFEIILRNSFNSLLAPPELDELFELDTALCADLIEIMAPTSANWCRKMLVARELGQSGQEEDCPRGLMRWESSSSNYHSWAVCEVDVRFLLMQFLAAAFSQDSPPSTQKLLKLLENFKKPFARIRYVVGFSERKEDRPCYRILKQEPLQGILSDIFTIGHVVRINFDEILPIIELPETAERVSIDAEVDMLVQEGFLSEVPYENPSFFPSLLALR
ncbi:hypothetical protein NW762_014161 [Fusarium torreyae]|uniref:NACHT domain-containing protein n=1 Tax=Fusarium torreyae TaxID=1237075 RepID=A0A9W8RMZ9_9HYPO|nr:hypothetical protein NW762_014161 [Fusarium torreyae]